MKKKQLVKVIALGLLVGPMAAMAQYDYQQIDFPGQAGSNFGGINDSGDAVGNSGSISGIGIGPDTTPFVYELMNGTMTQVAPAAGYLSTSITGINDAGVMVGSVLGLDGNSQSGVIRSKNGEYTVIDHLDAVFGTKARAINNKGLVTGHYHRADVTIGGFLYDPDTDTFTDLAPSYSWSIAHGINSKGVVVGDTRFEVDPCGGQSPSFSRYGWVRARDGSVVLFQVNGQPTRARGINDAGFVAGVVNDPLSGGIKGFVVELPKTNCESIEIDSADLLQFPGGLYMYPEGITNSGDVVGLFFDDSGSHGFIATEK
jgi:uncharacterized membrane protein